MRPHSPDYQTYLRSPQWRAKRAAVLDRCLGVCERCDNDIAHEVHHRTYDRLGNERLEDLEALCDTCHPIADQERSRNVRDRTYSRRVAGWALKRWGEDWEDRIGWETAEAGFEEWLDRQ